MEATAGGGVKKIQIRRAVSGGYGFSLMGGKGTEFPPVICDILEESPAFRCSQICVGDTITEINGESMSGRTTKQVVTALMKSPDDLSLTLKDDEEVRQRLFEFLGHLDQPPGFSQGSLRTKERKVVRQDFRGANNNGDVTCMTEMTHKDTSSINRRTDNKETDVNGLESAGPSSPPDSGYSTSVSTNENADSLSTSHGREDRMRAKLDTGSARIEAVVDDRTSDGGSVVTTTAVVHTEHERRDLTVDIEGDVFYDAEGSSSEGNVPRNTRVQGEATRTVIPRSEHSEREAVDGQCLSAGSQPECNMEDKLPLTPPPSPTQREEDKDNWGSPQGAGSPVDVSDVTVRLSSLQGATGGPLPRSESTISDFGESSSSASRESNKHLDYPSAKRLAQRLFTLDGFKVTDVAVHLCKQNDFSQLVAEEYFSHHMFTGDRLDQSLRKFLAKVALTGETQERERVLRHFAKRYHDCNGGLYQSESAVNTLTCALMLLNTDLNGKNNIGKKMTLNGFIRNMDGLNDGGNFPPETLKAFFQAIKTKPLEWAQDSSSAATLPGAKAKTRNGTMKLSGAPFLQMETDPNAPVYMKGYIMRKCIREADGKKPSRSKRKWKLFYGTVKGLVLYLHKTEVAADSNLQLPKEAISLHHSLAGKITDYKKRPFVFSLRLANWKEYLMQCTEQPAMQNWMQAMNLSASIHSSPPLPAAVGRQKRFSRPLLPSSSSKLSWQDQLKNHETKAKEMEEELNGHRASPPDKTAKAIVTKDYSLKMTYLEYEIMRFKTYSYLLQSGTDPTIPEGATEPFEGNRNSPADASNGGNQPVVLRADKVDSRGSFGSDSTSSGEDFLTNLPVNEMEYSTQL